MMTQEEKQLLLKDLCARISYHVIVKVWLRDGTTEEGSLDLQHNYGDVLRDAFYYNKIVDIKPYLRPLSSMTKEENKEAKENGCIIYLDTSPEDKGLMVVASPKGFDWLNKKMFDYRGLIPMGLALEAPEGMYE